MKYEKHQDKVAIVTTASSGIGKIMKKTSLNKPCRSGF
jgi:NADP-dependent 3-hydroxy acid dehydrogenase YdfG